MTIELLSVLAWRYPRYPRESLWKDGGLIEGKTERDCGDYDFNERMRREHTPRGDILYGNTRHHSYCPISKWFATLLLEWDFEADKIGLNQLETPLSSIHSFVGALCQLILLVLRTYMWFQKGVLASQHYRAMDGVVSWRRERECLLSSLISNSVQRSGSGSFLVVTAKSHSLTILFQRKVFKQISLPTFDPIQLDSARLESWCHEVPLAVTVIPRTPKRLLSPIWSKHCYFQLIVDISK